MKRKSSKQVWLDNLKSGIAGIVLGIAVWLVIEFWIFVVEKLS